LKQKQTLTVKDVMNKSLLLAVCMTVAVSAQAITRQEVSASVSAKWAAAKEACVKAAARTKEGVAAFGSTIATSVTNANSNVDAAITSKIGWFKTHNNVLQASKGVVVTAAVAGVCYMLKKAYDNYRTHAEFHAKVAKK
jgi:tRNA U38,U39,U40 pseudouridine synthase TruA